MEWYKVLNNDLTFNTALKILPSKGHLVYEYNPFRNYRLSTNKYYYREGYYTIYELFEKYQIYPMLSTNLCLFDKGDKFEFYKPNDDNKPTGYDLNKDSLLENSNLFNKLNYYYRFNQKTKWYKILDAVLETKPKKWNVSDSVPELYEKGLLVDFVTDQLSFDLEHPVSIVPLYSYDGSVNLILNDGINIPRLINSRFSATGKNTYEIVDRKGNNDTNIYDEGEQFDIDTSLYKRIVSIPKIEFDGTEYGGNLKVGNYYFYFKYSDADGNETDFVGESGLVSVFIGEGNPASIHTGSQNQNSLKSVRFTLSNVDSAYDYITVYYSRSTAQASENILTEYCKINKKFKVNNFGIAKILINGFDETVNVTANDINLNYNIVDAAYTQAECQNMLFMANVHKSTIPYKELTNLSLHFLPMLHNEPYQYPVNENYQFDGISHGYYDSKFIYNKLGYWNEEIYRIGIIYIMPNNELTPVFNIRGADNITELNQYWELKLFDEEGNIKVFNYNEETYEIIANTEDENQDSTKDTYYSYQNIKGVVRLKAEDTTSNIFALRIHVSNDVIKELKKYVKGYFFVRQTRIPLTLAQGLTIGVDNISRTPTIPTKGGFLEEIAQQTDVSKTHIQTSTSLNNVLYVSEGFLSRYQFELKPKNNLMNWISLGISALATALSFFPPFGTVASLVLNVANCVVMSAISGKFLVGSFVAAVVSALPAVGALGGALGKVGTFIATTGSTVTNVTSQLVSDITKVANALIKVGEATSKVAPALTALASGVGTATHLGITLSNQGFSSHGVNGRKTEIPKNFKKEETKESRKIGGEFIDRIIFKALDRNLPQAIICPDYEINQAHYNQIFTGNKFNLTYSKTQGSNITSWLEGQNETNSNYLNNENRHFYFNSYMNIDLNNNIQCRIVGVPDNTKCIGINKLKFRSRAGEAEEAWRYEYIGEKYSESKQQIENSDIIRGAFGPYLACDATLANLSPAMYVNIMIPGYNPGQMNEYFRIRMQDNSSYYAISDRIDINRDQYLYSSKNQFLVNTNDETEEEYDYILYRGDCYICQFTHRLNRNFNDPSAPYNDEIVDENNWKEYYNPDKTEQYADLNLGDVNAVQMGMWITMRLRSSNNLNIRTLDESNVDETAICGHARGYYPYYGMITEGNYKNPESYIYNKGFTKSVSDRWNFELPDVPYIKNWFGTRIMYSDIHINDAYKNGFRTFQGTNYRDYTREYGEITKLISLNSALLVVFEHGIGLATVNKQAPASQAQSGNKYVTTNNVLPEDLKIISDTFGSQWADSVLKAPGNFGDSIQYIYGVDTVAKKIWRTNGNTLQCISDFKVQEFLNNNITLGERELTPKIGIRNVKTVYNAFKRDVLFTFYDNTYGYEEKAWCLCWNELLGKWITFYSWIPSVMENIDNIPFSFDRNTSKWLAKLGVSHTENSFADGVTVSNVILNTKTEKDSYKDNNDTKTYTKVVNDYTFDFTYTDNTGKEVPITLTVDYPYRDGFIGVLSLKNRILPDSNMLYHISYELERDDWKNYEMFEVKTLSPMDTNEIKASSQDDINGLVLPDNAQFKNEFIPIYALYFKTASDDAYFPVYYHDDANVTTENPEGESKVLLNAGVSADDKANWVYFHKILNKPEAITTELYYRNQMNHAYADVDANKVEPGYENLYYSVQPGDDNKAPNIFPIPFVDLNEDGTLHDLNATDWVFRKYDLSPKYDLDGNIITGTYIEALNDYLGLFEQQSVIGFGSSSVEWNEVPVENNGNENVNKIKIPVINCTRNPYPCTKTDEFVSLLQTNYKGQQYVHGPLVYEHFILGEPDELIEDAERVVYTDLPIFKDLTGRRKMLPKELQLNPNKIVTYLNLKAQVNIVKFATQNDTLENQKSSYNKDSGMIDAGYYTSTIALCPEWNLQFMTSDFWKHGQAGLIDITDDIFPTYWYGKQHPFEFECIVVNDPSIHKIFTNLELVANKAEPESFHYEVIGEVYDFAKDKPNMFIRQEALKALWQYNGADIVYDRNFLKVLPNQLPKSADLPHTYYARQDTVNDIEDYYVKATDVSHDYSHLSGGEIVYYPNRQEFRIWNHVPAINIDNLPTDKTDVKYHKYSVNYYNKYGTNLKGGVYGGRSLIAGNMRYLEDRWKITINPIVVCYKNEYDLDKGKYGNMFQYSTWINHGNQPYPKLPIYNSPIPEEAKWNIIEKQGNQVEFPPVLTKIGYSYADIDKDNWLNRMKKTQSYDFGEAMNRKEVDVRDKFLKVRIRYSGEDLAVIDFLNTVYQISYS